MIRISSLSILLAFVILFDVSALAQGGRQLPRSTPEREGVSSADILKFLDATAKGKTEFHSYMLLRHGKVIAEGWWSPYKPNLKHTLYSCSKSFTATAVGFAVHEKLLSLDDKVVSFFPDDLPDTVSENLSALSIKDVLIMSDGQDPDPTFAVTSKDSNWVKGFLSRPVLYKPGTRFLYNSLGTYMLSAIVHKVTGTSLLDYLRPRLFEPLGIDGMDWETDPKGINSGGWGLRLKTEDMAKFAQLFLQKGTWNGKQVIPLSWVEEAISRHILQDPDARQSKRDSSDWLQGYGYQMWRCRHNAYRGDGAFGQFMIVMPEQDAVLAITAESGDMQEEINLVWKYILPAFKDKKLPPNRVDYPKLVQRQKNLSVRLPFDSSGRDIQWQPKKYTLNPNGLRFKQVSFSVSNNICSTTFYRDSSQYTIRFGRKGWQSDETAKPGPSLLSWAIQNTSFLYPAKVAATYSWQDAHTLKLVLRYIESPHAGTFLCRFNGDHVTIERTQSFDGGNNKITLQGTAVSD